MDVMILKANNVQYSLSHLQKRGKQGDATAGEIRPQFRRK